MQRREAVVYARLWAHAKRPPAARVLGSVADEDAHYLYLEEVRPAASWPWSHTSTAEAVCRALAMLHDNGPRIEPLEPDWNYEAVLARSAEDTLELAPAARYADGVRCWRRVGDLKRVMAALPQIRARVLADGPTLIHGDVHTGNAILRAGRTHQVALIDWARARMGSPLEDVASWLHSLGCWEPEAKRRHDTLLRAYLDSRRVPQRLDAALRERYWLASASNGLSGAIRYHLAVVGDPASANRARGTSGEALRAWERVIRRASAVLRPSPARSTSGSSTAGHCSTRPPSR